VCLGNPPELEQRREVLSQFVSLGGLHGTSSCWQGMAMRSLSQRIGRWLEGAPLGRARGRDLPA
jgi:hypothetical protein